MKDPRDYSDEAEPCKSILGAAELLFMAADFFELAPNWRPRPPNGHG
jgi:hypothetical protein